MNSNLDKFYATISDFKRLKCLCNFVLVFFPSFEETSYMGCRKKKTTTPNNYNNLQLHSPGWPGCQVVLCNLFYVIPCVFIN